MAYISQLHDKQGEELYPITIESAVRDSSGVTVETKISSIREDVNSYDVSYHNSNQTFSLSEAIGLVPTNYRRAGIKLSFISGDTNKYEEWYLTASAWTTNTSYWQGVDNTPIAGSDNTVKSGGLYDTLGIQLKNPGYINKTTGIPAAASAHGYSDLIPVDNKTNYKARLLGGGSACVISFYDKESNFISCISGTTELAEYNGQIPDGIYFIRFCTLNKANGGYYAFLNGQICQKSFDTFNSSAIIENGYFNINGVFASASAWRATDYISIEPYQQIIVEAGIIPSTVSIICFYDSDKNLISHETPQGTTTKMYIYSTYAPSDAAYFRTCTHRDYVENFNVLVSRFSTPIIDSFDIKGDSTDFVTGAYLSTSGAEVATTYWRITDYITVTSGARYNINVYEQSGTTCPIIFYNKDKIIVSKVVSDSDGITNVKGVVPSGATYVRMCTSYKYNFGESTFVFSCDLAEILNTLGSNSETLKYGNNFTGKPFNFSGSSAVFFGDSITYGVASSVNSGLTIITNCYRKVLSDTLGFTTSVNNAVSGSLICDLDNSSTSILNKVLSEITAQSNYNFIFILGGVNDYWSGKPVGTITDNTYETFYGALNVMCNHLKTNATNSQVIFITPINCTRNDVSTAVASLDVYRNAIFEVATINGFNVVDASIIGFPKDKNETAMREALIADGVHPTESGHFMMGKNIAAILL